MIKIINSMLENKKGSYRNNDKFNLEEFLSIFIDESKRKKTDGSKASDFLNRSVHNKCIRVISYCMINYLTISIYEHKLLIHVFYDLYLLFWNLKLSKTYCGSKFKFFSLQFKIGIDQI